MSSDRLHATALELIVKTKRDLVKGNMDIETNPAH